MSEWLVNTPNGEIKVSALEAIINAGGDLMFKIQDGCVKHAFSKNAWSECKLVETAPHGYVR